MRICFLATADSIHSKKWIEFFTKRGHEIHWITLTPNYFGEIKNVKIYFFKKYPGKALDIALNVIPIRRLIKKINPDILHAHYAGVNGVLAALSGFHPFVLTAWGSDILITVKSKIVKPLIKFALNKADLITCDAGHMEEAIIKLGADAAKIKIINFGINVEKFSPHAKDENLIKELKIQDSSVIISLRNFEPIYNIETLIRAIPIVVKELPKAKFIIAGKGQEEERLKNLVKNLKIEENVRFIGFIRNDDLPRYLRTADIYVSTSLSDAGIAASTAEAMACGLPVVITTTGENEKWVKDGEGGCLIPIKNPGTLAQKLIYLMKNENLRKEAGLINRKTIEEKNNYYEEMGKMEKIYKYLI